MDWKGRIQRAGHRFGVHVAHYPLRTEIPWRRQRMFEWLGVDLLFDVGANVGQYAIEVRDAGYAGRIVSFEPVETAFRELEERARADPRWEARQIALGAEPGEAEINVAAGGATSSSILRMAPRYLSMLPQDRYVGTQAVAVTTLDAALGELSEPSGTLGLKMDVQGYELEVLRGGAACLARAVFVESEMAFVELYHEQAQFPRLVQALYDAGLRFAGFEAGHSDATGALLWGNAIFVRDP